MNDEQLKRAQNLKHKLVIRIRKADEGAHVTMLAQNDVGKFVVEQTHDSAEVATKRCYREVLEKGAQRLVRQDGSVVDWSREDDFADFP